MDFGEFSHLNWLAIAVGAVGAFLLGGLWYTALFGKTWIRLHNYTEEKMKAMHAKRPPAIFFTGLFICYAIISISLAMIVHALNATTATGGLHIGLHVWLIVAAVGMTAHLAADRHIGLYAIDILYQLLYIVGLGALFAVWH